MTAIPIWGLNGYVFLNEYGDSLLRRSAWFLEKQVGRSFSPTRRVISFHNNNNGNNDDDVAVAAAAAADDNEDDMPKTDMASFLPYIIWMTQ